VAADRVGRDAVAGQAARGVVQPGPGAGQLGHWTQPVVTAEVSDAASGPLGGPQPAAQHHAGLGQGHAQRPLPGHTGFPGRCCPPSGHAAANDKWKELIMTGDTMVDLLQPLIGKSGSISMLVSRIGQVALPTAESKKLTGVQVRPDGLVRLERETGWTVIDPNEVVAVVWNGDLDSGSPGQFL
jgi:hypothetical protein